MSQTIRGQYEVQQEIGSGGMGKVYQAKDLKLNRTVAIKALLAGARGNEERRRRFIIEAQSASALNHPNIITIFDIIEEDGADYMVMEYLPGKTLIELIPRGGMRFPQVIKFGVQIADGLAAAHSAGIVHRDLKPGNIIISDRGNAKILDFGLAKLTETALQDDPDATSDAPLTIEGSIMGTLSYMSPEQAQGKKVDARSDIFSLGAVLYEMATGQRAFPGGSSAMILTSVLRDEPRSVRELSPEVPEELEQAIWRCLRKEPDERWQTMEDLHKNLLSLQQISDSGVLYKPRSIAPGDLTATIQMAPTSATVTAASAVHPPVIGKSGGMSLLKWIVAGVGGLILILVVGGLWLAQRAVDKLSNVQNLSRLPIEISDKGVSVGSLKIDTSKKDGLDNSDIEQMVKAKLSDSLILSQIRSSKTNFDLSSEGVIGLVKGGVSEKLIEAMRNPTKIPVQPGVLVQPRPTIPGGAPTPTQSTPTQSVPNQSTASPVAVAKSQMAEKLEDKKLAPKALGEAVVVPDGTPVSLELDRDVPADAAVGAELFFAVSAEVKVGGKTVIVKGATAKGAVLDKSKKKLLVIGAKTMYQLVEVSAVGGGTLKLRSTPRAFEVAVKDKKLAATKGGVYIGYIDGEQKLATGR